MTSPPLCPKCDQPLKPVEQEKNSPLNYDQWKSTVAGDWFCTCHNNFRGNKPYAYYFNGQFPRDAEARPVPQPATEPEYPIRLTERQEAEVKLWAADDRLWTTQETVEFNLRTFARKVLALREPATEPKWPDRIKELQFGLRLIIEKAKYDEYGTFEDVRNRIIALAEEVLSSDAALALRDVPQGQAELIKSLKEFVSLANWDGDTVCKTNEEWDAMIVRAETAIADAEARQVPVSSEKEAK